MPNRTRPLAHTPILLSALAALAVLAAPPSRADVTVSLSAMTASGQAASDALRPGDEIVGGVTVRNDGTALEGLSLLATGYDPAVVTLSALDATNGPTDGPFALFNTSCFTARLCSGGLAQTTAPSGREFVTGGVANVSLFRGTSATPITNTGVIDRGIATGRAGDPQIRVTFRVVGLGATHIDFTGSLLDASGQAITTGAVVGAGLSILAVPEPSTGLLLGLGLAMCGRRSRAESA